MALLDEPVIRDTVAFPKNQAGVDPMSGAPAAVGDDQLTELGLQLWPMWRKPIESAYLKATSAVPRKDSHGL